MKSIAGKAKRILSVIMACLMIVSVIPASSMQVYATEGEVEVLEDESIEIMGEVVEEPEAIIEEALEESFEEISEESTNADSEEESGQFYWCQDEAGNLGWYKNNPVGEPDSVRLDGRPNPGQGSYVIFYAAPDEEVAQWLAGLSGKLDWLIASECDCEIIIGNESNDLHVDCLDAFRGNVTLYGSTGRLRIGAESIEVTGNVGNAYIGSEFGQTGAVLVKGNIENLSYYMTGEESDSYGFEGNMTVQGTIARAQAYDYKYNADLGKDSWVLIYTIDECPAGLFKVEAGKFDSNVPLKEYVPTEDVEYFNWYQCYCFDGVNQWVKQINMDLPDGSWTTVSSEDCEIFDVENNARFVSIYGVSQDEPVVLDVDIDYLEIFLEGNADETGKITVNGNVNRMQLNGYREAWDVTVNGNLGYLDMYYYPNPNHHIYVSGNVVSGYIRNKIINKAIGVFNSVKDIEILKNGQWSKDLFLRTNRSAIYEPAFNLVTEEEKKQALSAEGIGQESSAADGTVVIKNADVSVSNTDTISDDDQAIISTIESDKITADSQLVSEVDINVSTYYVDKDTNNLYSASGYEMASVSELSDELEFTLLLPDSIYDEEADYNVVRKHVTADGETQIDVLETEQEGNKITFASDKFSTFMVVSTKESSGENETDPSVPAGPQNVKFDIKTGLVTYTSGDTYDASTDQGYHFSLVKDNGPSLKRYSVKATKKGKEEVLSFEGLLTETGAYQLQYWTSYRPDGLYETTTDLVAVDYEYTRPEATLSTPKNVQYNNGIISWDAVADAQSYMIEITGTIKGEQRNILLPTVKTSEVVSNLAHLFENATATVYAIPKDATLYASSLPSKPIVCEKLVMFKDTFKKVILGDIDNYPTVSVVKASGEAVSGVTYKSSNPAVAVIASNGKITALSAGTTTITAIPKGYNFSINMEISVVKELYYVGAVNAAATKFVAGSAYTDYIYYDKVQILSSPADLKINSVSYKITGDEKNRIEVFVDTGDYTNRTAIVSAHNLDSVENQEQVIVTFTVEDETGKTMSFDKEYILCPMENIPLLDCYEGHSFALRDKVLEAVKIEGNNQTGLPEGWNWIDGKQDITKYNGNGTYYFGVVYDSPSNGKIYDKIPVTFATPDLSAFTDLKSTMLAGQISEQIKVTNNGTFTLDDYKIVSSNTNVIDVKSEPIGENVNIFNLAAVNKGTATVDFYVGGVKVASKKISVLNGSYAEEIINVMYNSDADEVMPDENRVYNFEMTTDGVDFDLAAIACSFDEDGNVDQSFTTSVTSSDTGVVKITNGTAVTNEKPAQIKLVGAGYAVLTITANDTLKTQKQIAVQVTDRSPNGVVIDKNTIVIDTGKKPVEGNIFDALYLQDSAQRDLSVVDFFDASEFDSKGNPKGNKITPLTSIVGSPEQIEIGGKKAYKINVCVPDPTTIKAGKYIMAVAYAPDNNAVFKVVNVKKVSTKPVFKITQKQVADLAYKNNNVAFVINGNGIDCTDVKIAELQYGEDYSYSNGLLSIYSVKGYKKLTFTCSSEEYDDVNVNVSVKTKESNFILSSTSGTIYKNINYPFVEVKVIDKATKSNISGELSLVNNEDKFYISTSEPGVYRIYLMPNAEPLSSEKLQLQFVSDKLAKKYTYTYTVKTANLDKAKLALGAKSLTMYNYPNQNAQVATSLKLAGGCTADGLFNSVSITEKVNTKLGASLDRTLSVKYDYYTGMVYVTKVSNSLKPGTYNFVLTFGHDALAKPISVTLPVKVVEAGTTAKNAVGVKVSAKNNVDLLDRANTYVTFVPKFTNAPADAEYELVGIEGKSASYFDFEGIVPGSNNVPLKEEANILEKETYSIKLVYDVYANGAKIRVTSPEVKLKFKTKKASAKLFAKTTNVFNVAYEMKDIELEARCGVDLVDIERIELTNMADTFESEMLYDDFSNKNIVLITYKPNGKTQKGKTYTLKYNVYLKGAAQDSKPISVSYKVSIAK